MSNSQKVYTEGELLDFLENVFGDSYSSGSGSNKNINFVCPVCVEKKGNDYNKKKLAVKIDGKSHLVKCWVCGYKSRNLLNLIRRFFPEALQDYIDTFLGEQPINWEQDSSEGRISDSELGLPQGFQLFAKPFYSEPNKYLKSYLKKRLDGCNDDIETLLWRWKFGFTEEMSHGYSNRVIFPSLSSDGSLNYFTSRGVFQKCFPKYKNPSVDRENIIFNEININWEKPLVLVEGPFDLIKSTQNSTCILGSELNEEYLLFQEIIKHKTPIVLALDPDAEKKTDEIAKRLYAYGIDVYIVNIPKPYKDAGEMNQSEFIELVQKCSISYTKEYALKRKIARIL